jgi:hypothetical protein
MTALDSITADLEVAIMQLYVLCMLPSSAKTRANEQIGRSVGGDCGLSQVAIEVSVSKRPTD